MHTAIEVGIVVFVLAGAFLGMLIHSWLDLAKHQTALHMEKELIHHAEEARVRREAMMYQMRMEMAQSYLARNDGNPEASKHLRDIFGSPRPEPSYRPRAFQK